ncbi:MAG: sulfotransferase [Actinomycetota bacterium]|nr:sulfotransferase [Actinomycetota bacterium]
MHAERRRPDRPAKDPDRLPPFFIIGVDRSGTTLLRSMLNRHAQLAIPPESHFIPRLWRRRRRYGSKDRIDRTERFLLDLGSDERYRHWDLPLDAVRGQLVATAAQTFSEHLEAVFRAYARHRGKTHWGDKTPEYAHFVPLLAGLFPQARFVHLIRDGRDVALSMLDRHRTSTHRTGKTPLHRHSPSPAFFWSRRIRIVRRAVADLEVDRYCSLRYEDLLDDPEEQLRRLCQFIGVEFDPAMLGHDHTGLEGVPPSQRQAHPRLALPPTKGLRDWRRQMLPREVAEFEAVARRQLARLGYPVVSGSPTLTVRLRAWARVASFAIRSLPNRIGWRVRHERRRRVLRRGLTESDSESNG